MRTRMSRVGERGVAKAIALPALFTILLAGHASPQATPAGQDHDTGLRISVDVALVVLPATVTDPQGGFVSNLVQQDFEVFENGARQSIRLFRSDDIPVTVGLVVDESSSMGPKLAEVAAAAKDAGVALCHNRVGSMFTWFFTSGPVTDWASAARCDTEAFGRFFRAMLENGIYLPPSQFEAAFLSAAHTELDVQETIARAKQAFATVAA